MKKRDSLTLIGIISGFAMVIWGMMGDSGLGIFWDFPSVVITVGGSFSALLITYSLEDMKSVGKIFFQSMRDTKISTKDLITIFSEISKKARKEGLLALENELSKIEDEFMKKGLQMVVDGIEPDTVKEILELEIDEMERRHASGANIFKTWGGYAPAFGMIGTLIGLIQMLANLTDSSNIASGMAVALITTFYGAIMANVILNPISVNLKLKSAKEASIRELIIEGILSIQSGVNPRIVEEKLATYLSPKERLEYLRNQVNSKEGVNING